MSDRGVCFAVWQQVADGACTSDLSVRCLAASVPLFAHVGPAAIVVVFGVVLVCFDMEIAPWLSFN